MEEQYLPTQTVPVPVHHTENFNDSVAEPDREIEGIVETADSRLCTGDIGGPMTVEKIDLCSFVGVAEES